MASRRAALLDNPGALAAFGQFLGSDSEKRYTNDQAEVNYLRAWTSIESMVNGMPPVVTPEFVGCGLRWKQYAGVFQGDFQLDFVKTGSTPLNNKNIARFLWQYWVADQPMVVLTACAGANFFGPLQKPRLESAYGAGTQTITDRISSELTSVQLTPEQAGEVGFLGHNKWDACGYDPTWVLPNTAAFAYELSQSAAGVVPSSVSAGTPLGFHQASVDVHHVATYMGQTMATSGFVPGNKGEPSAYIIGAAFVPAGERATQPNPIYQAEINCNVWPAQTSHAIAEFSMGITYVKIQCKNGASVRIAGGGMNEVRQWGAQTISGRGTDKSGNLAIIEQAFDRGLFVNRVDFAYEPKTMEAGALHGLIGGRILDSPELGIRETVIAVPYLQPVAGLCVMHDPFYNDIPSKVVGGYSLTAITPNVRLPPFSNLSSLWSLTLGYNATEPGGVAFTPLNTGAPYNPPTTPYLMNAGVTWPYGTYPSQASYAASYGDDLSEADLMYGMMGSMPGVNTLGMMENISTQNQITVPPMQSFGTLINGQYRFNQIMIGRSVRHVRAPQSANQCALAAMPMLEVERIDKGDSPSSQVTISYQGKNFYNFVVTAQSTHWNTSSGITYGETATMATARRYAAAALGIGVNAASASADMHRGAAIISATQPSMFDNLMRNIQAFTLNAGGKALNWLSESKVMAQVYDSGAALLSTLASGFGAALTQGLSSGFGVLG